MKPEDQYPMKIMRIDLGTGKKDVEEISNETARKYVGGTGLGAKYLYEEVPPGVEWSDPKNRMMWFTGPLAGTKVAGSGSFSVISKGPMTNMAGASQANGFLGAFLRFSGLHGLIIQGSAKKWTRLHIHDDEFVTGKEQMGSQGLEQGVFRAVATAAARLRLPHYHQPYAVLDRGVLFRNVIDPGVEPE